MLLKTKKNTKYFEEHKNGIFSAQVIFYFFAVLFVKRNEAHDFIFK